MRELEFKDYSKRYQDADGDEHVQVVRAAVIGDNDLKVKNDEGNDRPREVMTPTGVRRVVAGDVYVETGTPGVYDHVTADGWEASGYSEGTKPKATDSADKPAAKQTANK